MNPLSEPDIPPVALCQQQSWCSSARRRLTGDYMAAMPMEQVLHPAVREQSWRTPLEKRTFIPLPQGYILAASALESWIELDLYLPVIWLTLFFYETSNYSQEMPIQY